MYHHVLNLLKRIERYLPVVSHPLYELHWNSLLDTAKASFRLFIDNAKKVYGYVYESYSVSQRQYCTMTSKSLSMLAVCSHHQLSYWNTF